MTSLYDIAAEYRQTADKLADLREEAVARLKAYRNRPPNNYVPRYLLQMEAEQKYAVVVDTQNGVPFFSRLDTRSPVVLLVHHIHREQWPVAGRVASPPRWRAR